MGDPLGSTRGERWRLVFLRGLPRDVSAEEVRRARGGGRDAHTNLEAVTSAQFSSAGSSPPPGSLQLASFPREPRGCRLENFNNRLTPFPGSPYPALLTLSPPGSQRRFLHSRCCRASVYVQIPRGQPRQPLRPRAFSLCIFTFFIFSLIQEGGSHSS